MLPSSVPLARATTPPAPDRLAWVDATRGLCVAGVVLFHVCLWWFLPMVTTGPAERLWGTTNSILGSVRMPLLLAVSGLVAARRIQVGLGDRGLLARAAANGYLYVVWLLVYAAFYTVVPGALPHRLDGPSDVATDLVVPETTLWYLVALPLYALGLAAVRRVPPSVVLLLLALVSVASRMLLGDEPGMWPRIVELAFFFAVGVYGAPRLRAFAAQVTVPIALGCAALAVATTLAGRVSDAEPYLGVLFLVRGTAFLLAAIALVVLLIRWGPVRRTAEAVGRRTLAIYVLHVLVIAVLIVGTPGTAAIPPAIALTLPVVATITIIVVCTAAERTATTVGLGVLFRMPERLRTAISGRPDARRA